MIGFVGGRANELFDRAKRCRDIFRKTTELTEFMNRASERNKGHHDEAVERAIEESRKAWEIAEARRKCLYGQLERWGYVERPVPDDNNCQFHAIADQLNIDRTFPVSQYSI